MILFNNHLSIGINKPLPIKRNDTPEVLILEEDKQLPEQGEKFDDVYAEMRANVPDSTSTIEEKELALQYIDRLLNCGDITDELKKYWTNKKEIIQMEMTTIKNIEKQGTELNSDDLFKELRQFYNVFGSKESFGSADQRIEYGIAYFNSVISYYSLILQFVTE